MFKGRRPTQKTTRPNKTVCANSLRKFFLRVSTCYKGKRGSIGINCSDIVSANCVFIWVGCFWVGLPFLKVSAFFDVFGPKKIASRDGCLLLKGDKRDALWCDHDPALLNHNWSRHLSTSFALFCWFSSSFRYAHLHLKSGAEVPHGV